MKGTEFVEKTELFFRALGMSPPPPDSFETINNMKFTIREYREYAQPNPLSWDNYILDVFNIFGFNTETETNGFLSLKEMGGKRSRRAVVQLVKQDENFNDIYTGKYWLVWLNLLLHKVDWVILTDGLKFKIFNHNLKNWYEIFLYGSLDELISDESIEGFYALCNIMSLIRVKPIIKEGRTTPKRHKHGAKYDLNYHIKNKSNKVITLVEVLRTKLKSLSNEIDERFNMKYIGYYSNGGFCQIHTQKSQLKIWVNLDIHEITDPLSLCRDVRKIGHYGTGNTEIVLKSFDELNAVFDIIQQAYKKMFV